RARGRRPPGPRPGGRGRGPRAAEAPTGTAGHGRPGAGRGPLPEVPGDGTRPRRLTVRPLIVAIDGPAGAGKSTVSQLLARRLGLTFVDTGALYRAVALSARRNGIATEDDAALGALLARIGISFQVIGEENRVFLDGEDVSEEIRTPPISLLASAVSA